MQYIKCSSALYKVSDPVVRARIALHMQTLSEQYAEAYQATLHGWFVICAEHKDLTATFPFLHFSLAEKLHLNEVEYIEQKPDWSEVYILLNDNEGILVYVPTALLVALLESHQ